MLIKIQIIVGLYAKSILYAYLIPESILVDRFSVRLSLQFVLQKLVEKVVHLVTHIFYLKNVGTPINNNARGANTFEPKYGCRFYDFYSILQKCIPTYACFKNINK